LVILYLLVSYLFHLLQDIRELLCTLVESTDLDSVNLGVSTCYGGSRSVTDLGQQHVVVSKIRAVVINNKRKVKGLVILAEGLHIHEFKDVYVK